MGRHASDLARLVSPLTAVEGHGSFAEISLSQCHSGEASWTWMFPDDQHDLPENRAGLVHAGFQADSRASLEKTHAQPFHTSSPVQGSPAPPSFRPSAVALPRQFAVRAAAVPPAKPSPPLAGLCAALGSLAPTHAPPCMWTKAGGNAQATREVVRARGPRQGPGGSFQSLL